MLHDKNNQLLVVGHFLVVTLNLVAPKIAVLLLKVLENKTLKEVNITYSESYKQLFFLDKQISSFWILQIAW